jgi:drug/metabolite transporter (DMT)-like permease
MGLAGVAFVFYENMFATIDRQLLIGLSISIFAMLAWSVGSILLARHPVPINPYYGMGWQMIIGAAILLMIAAPTHQLISPSEISLKGWMQVGYLAFVGSILTFIAFLYTLKTLPATVSSLYAYVNPIVAIITAAVFLDEKLTGTIMLGTVITITGVFIVNHFTHHDEEQVIAESEI